MKSLRLCSELRDKREDRVWLRNQEVHPAKEDQEDQEDHHQGKEALHQVIEVHLQVKEVLHQVNQVKVHHLVTQLTVVLHKAALHQIEDLLQVTICLATPIL